MQIVLASRSPYRKQQLESLGLVFECFDTGLDESTLKRQYQQQPAMAAKALSEAKAQLAGQTFPEHLVLAGDQVAEFDGELLSKPGSRDKAVAQLMRFSGKVLQLHTCLSVLYHGQLRTIEQSCRFLFRNLNAQETARYVDFAQPLDCAGAFKIEQGGIALFEKIECEDFTAIQGVPLLALARELRSFGVELFV